MEQVLPHAQKEEWSNQEKRIKLSGTQSSTKSTSAAASSVVKVESETSGKETCGPEKRPIGRKKEKDTFKEELVSLNLLKKMPTAHSTISDTAKKQSNILEAQQVQSLAFPTKQSCQRILPASTI